MKKTKRQEKLRSAREKEMQNLLKRVGFTGKFKNKSPNEIPDYRTSNYEMTSNNIPGNGSKIRPNTYSGDEIMGVVTTHKSNLMPIRKDNPQAAIDVAQMRRG
jgi:hypothetical protein